MMTEESDLFGDLKAMAGLLRELTPTYDTEVYCEHCLHPSRREHSTDCPFTRAQAYVEKYG